MADSKFGYCVSKRSPETRPPTTEHFIVEDLLDFSNDGDVVVQDDVVFDDDRNTRHSNSNSNSNSCDGSSNVVVTPPGSGNSSFSGNNDAIFPSVGDVGSHRLSDTNFSGELCVPYDDLAELEWLSHFVEESFSSEDLRKSHLISGMTSAVKTWPDLTGSPEARFYNTEPLRPETTQNPIFVPEVPVPGKARSKRSRAPGNWTSRLKVLSTGSPISDSPLQIGSEMKPAKPPSKRKCGLGYGPGPGSRSGSELSSGEVRRCLHCATDKTPQWRTGPLGPKTLCNACGVRYKSGRLVPEYRPASSPTFVLTKHSNSHRKVMELRRQKEAKQQQQQQQYIHQQQYHYQQEHRQIIHPNNMIFDPPNNPDDYLIHQHTGSDYNQLT
ncbi:hypothetical protein RND81_10G164300 [Saponaria officinalis]|uniref:GATA transcription factor n=1 Tax=Saponaria officinalis TaxID=3572 RepID=A0AAW1I5A9_SAPOF